MRRKSALVWWVFALAWSPLRIAIDDARAAEDMPTIADWFDKHLMKKR
jgi:hypothetical protein